MRFLLSERARRSPFADQVAREIAATAKAEETYAAVRAAAPGPLSADPIVYEVLMALGRAQGILEGALKDAAAKAAPRSAGATAR